MADFENRVVIITGAAAGLGASYARWLAARGARLLLNDIRTAARPDGAAPLAAEIRAGGGEAVADYQDVAVEGAGETIVRSALDVYGRVDVVIANTGSGAQGNAKSVSLSALRRSMAVNFWGAIEPVMAALPHMLKQNYGRIVLTSSSAGLFGQDNLIGYAAAKTALVGFTRVLAIDTAQQDIRVNVLAPNARTDMSKEILPESFELLMPASKVAPVAGWLASEACSISGEIVATGAGRLRRNAIVEGPVISFEGDDAASAWDSAHVLRTISEPRSSVESAMEMIPELRQVIDSARSAHQRMMLQRAVRWFLPWAAAPFQARVS